MLASTSIKAVAFSSILIASEIMAERIFLDSSIAASWWLFLSPCQPQLVITKHQASFPRPSHRQRHLFCYQLSGFGNILRKPEVEKPLGSSQNKRKICKVLTTACRRHALPTDTQLPPCTSAKWCIFLSTLSKYWYYHDYYISKKNKAQ